MNGKRRSIRLKGYDYGKEGWYFVTIDLENKGNLFWKENNKFELNGIGKMIEKIILDIPIYYSGILIDEYIVMPNHVHLIINIEKGRKWDGDDDEKGRKWDSARTLNQNIIVGADPCIRPNGNMNSNIRPNNNLNSNFSLSEIIQRFKILSTNRYIDGVKNKNWPRFEKRLWQRNYYERIVRNEEEYLRIEKYIKNNPEKWIKKSPLPSRGD